MTTVRPLARFNIARNSIRPRLTQRSCRKIAPNGVINSISDLSNQDSEDVGFCGEPFADNGELLSSLSPLLFSMKLFGLYFHREDRHRQPADDQEWNPATPTGTFFSGLRVYATSVLFLVWFNVVRLFALFDKNDHFGALLLMKIMIFAAFSLAAIMYSAYYYASHTRKLDKVLLTLPVTSDCVTATHRLAVGITATIWLASVVNLSILAYVHFSSEGDYDFTIAPFSTYIGMPKNMFIIVKMCGYLTYMFIFPGSLFAHAMSLLIVCIFYHQFKKLDKHFRHAVGKQGRFNGDLSSFRRRHQTLCRAVGKADGFLMFSNVGGFVCHVANMVILLYSIAFYRESTATPVCALAHVFWLVGNIKGLCFSASTAILVNHMAHKLGKRIYDINMSAMDSKTVSEIIVFLIRLKSEPIGFSVLGIFVIDKNTILMVLGLLITYFVLVVQFVNPAAGSPSTDGTNSTAAS